MSTSNNNRAATSAGGSTSSSSNQAAPSTPSTTFQPAVTFGSHKGKTFEAMRRDHPDYIAWCQKQESPKSAMKALIDFCDGKNNTDYTSRAPTAVRAPTSSSAPHFTAALGGPSSPTRRMSSHHQPDVIDLTAEPDCPPALGPQLPDIDLTISDYSPPRVVAPLPYLQPGIDLTLSDYEKFQRETPKTHRQVTTPGGGQKVGFGKYKHMTYDQVKRKDPGYCRWVLGVGNVKIKEMKDFQQFIKRAEFLKAGGTSSTPKLKSLDYSEAEEAASASTSRSGSRLGGISHEDEKDLANLLENAAEGSLTPIHLRMETPPEMTITLLPHQQLGVEWMLKMERGSNKGGILADDMGLGKTVQSIATIVANRPPKATDSPRGTLIIGPMALLNQWEEEINDKTDYLFKVCQYHGTNREKSVKALEKYDIVLTTYGIVQSEFFDEKKGERKKAKRRKKIAASLLDPLSSDGDDAFIVNDDEGEREQSSRSRKTKTSHGILHQKKWWRIILDEAHTIKNRTTGQSMAASNLEAELRWCLTGTPIQNNIEDVYAMIRFLRIKPYDDWAKFNDHISKPFKEKSNSSLVTKRLHAILRAILLRRTKDYVLDGKKILELPPRQVIVDESVFNKDEQDFYETLFKKAQVKFNGYVVAGTVMKNYHAVLTWILRLRQACCHPSLIFAKNGEKGELVVEDGRIDPNIDHLLDSMADDVVARINNNLEEQSDCPICLDLITDEKISVVCGHSFCADCLTALLARDTSCPQCRKDITHKGFVDLRDFLKRFNPDAWNEMESEEAEVRDLAAKAPVGDAVAAMLADGVGYAGGRSKGKGKAQDCQMPQLKQIYADVIQFDGNFVPSTKLHRCLEIISETSLNHPGEKIIIFSQFASFLDVLQTPLKARGIEHERYDGKMSRMARVRAIDRFRSDPHCYVILVSLKCGSLGLNLTAANHVVLCDLWWNPAVENQAIDRAHRIGQDKTVYVHRLTIKDSIEERILALQEDKKKIADSVLGIEKTEGGARAARLNIKDLMSLFK